MALSGNAQNGRWLLLLDTCGEVGSVALAQEHDARYKIAAESWLEERSASTTLMQAIRAVLRETGIAPDMLGYVGVVAGPGSFTGVRVGMAVAKGLCVAGDLPLIPVSRLAVLAAAAQLRDGYAVLRAGRDQVFVQEQTAEGAQVERLLEIETLLNLVQGRAVAYTEELLASSLRAAENVRRVAIAASSALPLVLRALPGQDPALADAHYVRDEQTIYKRSGPVTPSL